MSNGENLALMKTKTKLLEIQRTKILLHAPFMETVSAAHLAVCQIDFLDPKSLSATIRGFFFLWHNTIRCEPTANDLAVYGRETWKKEKKSGNGGNERGVICKIIPRSIISTLSHMSDWSLRTTAFRNLSWRNNLCRRTLSLEVDDDGSA